MNLLIFPFGYLSHYLRCIVLADHLKHYFNILFAHHEEYLTFIHSAGYKTFECKSLKEKEVLSKARAFDFSWLNTRDLEEVFLDQVQTIEKYRPAAVLGDSVPTLAMAAEKTGVPYIALFNGYMSKYYKGQRHLPDVHPVSAWLRVLPHFISDNLVMLGETITFKEIHKPFQKIRSKYGLKKKKSYLDELEGDQNLICDLSDLFPQSRLPENYMVLGPLIYRKGSHTGSFSLHTDPAKKTIVISMGSTGNWKTLHHLNDPCFNKYNIVAAGDKQNILNVPHIIRTEFIAAEGVLPGTDLVICHGGNGTIYQVLAFGVPVLCIPTHFEQEWNVQALVKWNVAKILKGYATPQQLLEQVQIQIENRQAVARTGLINKIGRAVESIDEKIFKLVCTICKKTDKPINNTYA